MRSNRTGPEHRSRVLVSDRWTVQGTLFAKRGFLYGIYNDDVAFHTGNENKLDAIGLAVISQLPRTMQVHAWWISDNADAVPFR
jgi:hypothetical protein